MKFPINLIILAKIAMKFLNFEYASKFQTFENVMIFISNLRSSAKFAMKFLIFKNSSEI